MMAAGGAEPFKPTGGGCRDDPLPGGGGTIVTGGGASDGGALPDGAGGNSMIAPTEGAGDGGCGSTAGTRSMAGGLTLILIGSGIVAAGGGSTGMASTGSTAGVTTTGGTTAGIMLRNSFRKWSAIGTSIVLEELLTWYFGKLVLMKSRMALFSTANSFDKS